MQKNDIMRLHWYFFLILLIPAIYGALAQDVEHPFTGAIRQFKENDRLNPPPEDAILFIGSSSFTMWQDVQDYFPEYTIINRGFGGSILTDQIRFADQIVFPYSPRQVVIYCGENDLANSDTVSGEMVIERAITLFNLIRSEMPDAKITYISMKPSPSRWHLAEKFIHGNQGICEFIESQPNASFIDIWDRMLDDSDRPDQDLFLEDMLHMNKKGYVIWQQAIEPELINEK